MIQTQRFYTSKDTGTHSKVPLKNKIPRNSTNGQGAGGSHIITDFEQ